MQTQTFMNALASVRTNIRRGALVLVATLVGLPTIGFAQNAGIVTLQFDDGRDSVVGRLTNYADNLFIVEAPSGLVAVSSNGVTCVGAACPGREYLDLEGAPVVLVANDGSTTIYGDLMGVENGAYVISTLDGEQRIPTQTVSCDSAACSSVNQTSAYGGFVELYDNGISLRGSLLGFDGNSFTVDDQVMGTIRVSANKYECRGEGCP